MLSTCEYVARVPFSPLAYVRMNRWSKRYIRGILLGKMSSFRTRAWMYRIWRTDGPG